VVARELHRTGRLGALVTDAWVPPSSWLRSVPLSALQGLRERYHPMLAGAPVQAWTYRLLLFELRARLRRMSGWAHVMERNCWFERHLRRFARRTPLLRDGPHAAPVVFAYSYAAHDLFVEAKRHGAVCVLDQIDAGPLEEDLVAAEHARYRRYGQRHVRAPEAYWTRWRAECRLADVIIVNSDWSRRALADIGIAGPHIRVVPLAYEPPADAPSAPRTYPDAFSRERPLRVLYLGTLTLRKGIARLVEAAHLVEDAPIEFTVVGGGSLDLPEEARSAPNIEWVGQVPRSATAGYYDRADLFVLPTLSDGFALTQLEAQAQGLPVIASARCGDVVRDKENGLRLDDVDPRTLAEALRWALMHPQALATMSRVALEAMGAYAPARVVQRLSEAVAAVARTRAAR
jgi:glycosyltransferase involved in cell wall biosynthesis